MVDDSDIQNHMMRTREELPAGSAIAGLDVQVGRDWAGDEAVWVWVVFRDDRIDQVWSTETRDALRERIRGMVRSLVAPADVEVYVRFRSEAEHRGVVGEAWGA